MNVCELQDIARGNFEKLLIQRAKAEVAREIFEEIEQDWEIYREEGKPPYFRFNYNKYKAIESKYTGGQKC